MDLIYLDTEYRDDAVILACAHIPGLGTGNFDLRTPQGVQQFSDTVDLYRHYVWVGYAIHAELTSMMRVGIDIADLKVIDLMAECRMITLTHEDHFAPSASLVDSLKAMGLHRLIPDDKDDTRDLILGNTEYTDEEWERIVTYCRQDTECLPQLWETVQHIHEVAGSPLLLPEGGNSALFRGEYVKNTAIADYRTRGFPIDVPWLYALLDNKERIINRLAEHLNERYARPLYVWNEKEQRRSRSQLGIHVWINSLRKQYGLDWEKTEKGTTYRTDKEYLEKKVLECPELEDFYESTKTIQALRLKADFREMVNEDGYIKAPTFAFRAMTGRNGPAPKRGFILGLPKWMRSLIRPKRGMAFVGADWSQQEIALAAVLSGDQNLLDVYNSGDCYLALAKRGGAIPPDGTKDEYPLERQMYKAVQLGIGYGKGLDALVMDVYHTARDADGNHLMSWEDAAQKAKAIWDWHHQEFKIYWDWILKETIPQARKWGWWATLTDDWTYFVGRNTRNTQMLNLPMQAHGAVLMRIATTYAVEEGLDLAATQHDSMYVNCALDDVEPTRNKLQQCMDAAVDLLFEGQVKIRVDTHVWTYDHPFRDETATKMLEQMQSLVKIELNDAQ